MIKGGATCRILTDHIGSPRLVVNSATGAVAQRMDFDEFGRVLLDTNPGFTPFGFADGLYDPETKLVRFGVPDYDPEAGRWTSKDPSLFAGRSLNLYAYVGNDPVNRTDPTGLLPGMPVGFPSLDAADWAGGLATVLNLLTPGAGTDVQWNGGNPLILLTNSPWALGNKGLTLGHVVVLKRDEVTNPGTYKHELAHVDQHDVLGAAYLPLHILAQIYSLLSTGDYVQANPLEHGPHQNPPCAF